MILDTGLTRELSIVIQLDGGMGRVLCATPAIAHLKERFPDRDITVITAFPEIFEKNPAVKKTYHLNSNYLWEDVIRYGEFIFPEPYHDVWYYNQKHHLVESFDHIINGETSEDVTPKIYLDKREISWAETLVKERRADTWEGKGRVGIFQAYGAGVHSPNCGGDCSCSGDLDDETYRSFPTPQLESLLETLIDADMVLLNASHIPIDRKGVWNGSYSTRQLMALTKAADFVITIDSFLGHVAKAFDKKCYQFLGSTFKENVSYPEFKTYQREGYPRAYTPNRFNGIIEGQNEGAMEFSKDEIKRIGLEIQQDLTPVKEK